MGQLNRARGEYDSSLKWYDTALKLAQEIPDSFMLGKINMGLGVVHYNLGNYSPALEFYLRLQSFLSIKEKLTLAGAHRQCHVKRYADRIKAILMLNSGYTFEQIAELLLMDNDTVRRYLNICKKEGVEGLMRDM